MLSRLLTLIKPKRDNTITYPVPSTYAKDYDELKDAFLIDVGPVTNSNPVYCKLLSLRELFAYYRREFSDPEQGPVLIISSHGFSKVSMTIKLRIPVTDKVEFIESSYDFQGNQLNQVMRNLKRLLVKAGVTQ